MVQRRSKRMSPHVEAASTPDSDDDLDPENGPKWLLDEAVKRGSDRPLRISVERLIAFWQMTILSNSVVQRIHEELELRDLLAEPDLWGLELDHVVELRAASSGAAPQFSDRGEFEEIGYCLGDLPSARNGLCVVQGDDEVTAIFHEMLAKGRDHVGVLGPSGEVAGYADHAGIVKALLHSPDVKAWEIRRPVLKIEASEQLFMCLPEIMRRGFVIVIDESGNPSGTVSHADVAAEYQRRMYPLSLIEEIELRLRRRLGQRVEVVYRTKSKGRSRSSWKRPDQLSFGDIVKLLEDDEVYKRMKWRMPRERLKDAVDRVRIIRNAVFHHQEGRPNFEDIEELEKVRRSLEGFDGPIRRSAS